MQWGQLVDHDLTAVVPHRGSSCSSCAAHNVSSCLPIPLPAADPHYRGQVSCIPFRRSARVAGQQVRAGLVPADGD